MHLWQMKSSTSINWEGEPRREFIQAHYKEVTNLDI